VRAMGIALVKPRTVGPNWIVHHARQIIFQLAEVAVSRDLFAAILERITRL